MFSQAFVSTPTSLIAKTWRKGYNCLGFKLPLPDILAMDDWVSNVMPNSDKFYNLYDEPFNAEQYRDLYVEWKWNKAITADGKELMPYLSTQVQRQCSTVLICLRLPP